MFNIPKLTKIMKKYQLKSVEGLILVHCAYIQDAKSLECLHELLQHLPNKIKIDSIRDLIAKKIIEPISESKLVGLNFMDIYVTKEFEDSFFIDLDIAGEELWSVYPNTTYIDGRSVILKKGEKIGDKYYDKDTLIEIYCNKIGADKEKHKQIIDLVKRANKEGVINFTLRSFILDELWDSLHDLVGTNNSYDNRKLI